MSILVPVKHRLEYLLDRTETAKQTIDYENVNPAVLWRHPRFGQPQHLLRGRRPARRPQT